jgi:hypothetical protein
MKKTVLLLLLSFVIVGAGAQRKKQPAVKKAPAAQNSKDPSQQASSQGMKLFKSLMPATAKVMFIDSVVVDKNDFLRQLPLSKEAGKLMTKNSKADLANQMGSYENELGLRRIYADGDSANSVLYTQTKLGDEWDKGSRVSDFNSQMYTNQNFPFLASDGVTLYFSAEGSESMGGRDIFMSSFDSDNSAWYKPQNVGLPFNSTANDYLLAIDDLDSLGWLVTDRRQPAGKVCIYTFVPTEKRQNFNDDNLDDEELTCFASLQSIKSTWSFGNRNAAMKRLENLKKRNTKEGNGNDGVMAFVVDDNTVITSPAQFKNDKSRQLYKQLVELQAMYASEKTKLETMRESYHNGNKSLSQNILKAEKQLENTKQDISDTEKQIRRIEKQG